MKHLNKRKNQTVDKHKKMPFVRFFEDRNKLYLLFGMMIVLFVFSKSLQCGFLNWDDDKQLTDNQVVKNFKGDFSTLYKLDKHTSLTLLTYAADYKIWRKSPLPYHAENVLLHLLNILLVFIFIRKLFNNSSVSLVCALLFAVHPSRVESVLWIAERKDLLFTMFSLLSLIGYLGYVNKNRPPVKQFFLYLGIAALSYLAALSKIQAVVIPIVFFMVDIYYKRRVNLISVFEKFVLIFFFFILQPIYISSLHEIRLLFSVVFLLIVFFFINGKSFKKSVNLFFVFFTLIVVLLSTQILLLLPFFVWFSYDRIIVLYFPVDKFKEDAHNFLKYFLKYKYFFAVILFVFIAFIMLAQHRFGFWLVANNPSISYTFVDRFFLGAYALMFYLFLFVFPFNLNAIHPYPLKSDGFLPIEYYLAMVGVIVIIFTVFYFIKNKNLSPLRKVQKIFSSDFLPLIPEGKSLKISVPLKSPLGDLGVKRLFGVDSNFKFRKEIIFLLLFFIVNIALVLHIIPIQGRLVTADRYSYFAYIGLFAVVGFIYEECKCKFRLFACKWIFLTVFLLLSSYSFIRSSVWESSVSLFTSVIEKNPTIAFAHSNLGAAMMGSGDFRKIILHLNRAIAIDSTLQTAYYNRAMVYYQTGEYEKSLKDIYWLIRTQKDSASQAISYNDMAMVKMEMGLLSDAKNDLEKSIKMDLTYAKPYNNRGRIKCLDGDLDGSIADFNHALLIMPDMDEAYANRGWSLALKGDRGRAMQDYQKAIEINPENDKAYANLGTMKVNMKDIKGGISDLNRAIEINPKFEIAYRNRGYAHFVENNLESCISDYSRAISLNPKSLDLFQNRGWAYFRNHDLQHALADFNKAVDMDNKNEISYVHRGWIKFQLHDSTSSLIDLSRAIELNNKSEKGHLFRGIVFYNQKKYAASFADVREVIKINKLNAEAFYYSGLCKHFLGKNNEACVDIDEAMRLGFSRAKEAKEKYCK